jgi:hypothetical protein
VRIVDARLPDRSTGQHDLRHEVRRCDGSRGGGGGCTST